MLNDSVSVVERSHIAVVRRSGRMWWSKKEIDLTLSKVITCHLWSR